MQSSTAGQFSEIERAIGEAGVDGIIFAPLEVNEVAPLIEKAKASGLSVVVMGTGAFTNFPSIGVEDSMSAAAAGFICENAGKESQAAILEGSTSNPISRLRSESAKVKLSECGIKVVETAVADWDTEKAKNIMADILGKYPDIKSVFALDDNMAVGAAEAVRQAKKSGIAVVGWDLSSAMLDGIKSGDIAAAVMADPANMGALALKTILKVSNRGSAEHIVDPGTVIVTRGNVESFLH